MYGVVSYMITSTVLNTPDGGEKFKKLGVARKKYEGRVQEMHSCQHFVLAFCYHGKKDECVYVKSVEYPKCISPKHIHISKVEISGK